MATQAEINKLWAEQLAQAGGGREGANMLRQKGLDMGLTAEQLNAAESANFDATQTNKPGSYARSGSSNLGLGGSMSVEPTGPTANTWNGGAAANAEQLAGAQEWVKGKTSEEIAAKGKELGLSPEQFGSVFGQSGDVARGIGYGSEKGLNDNAKGVTWNGSAWVNSNQAKQSPSASSGPGNSAAQATTVSAGPAANAGPGSQSQSTGYNAQNTNIAGQYANMGLSDPSGANARLLSGEVNNPYLDAQADNITKRLNRNLQENILPGIGQGAQASGQYGGSRQGIAQGKAIGDSQDNLANALTNMYSGANEAAQGRMAGAAGNLSGIGAQVGISNTSGQNQAAQFGANAANQNSQFNAGQNNQMSQFNTGQRNAMSQFNTGQANQGNQFNAGQSNSFNLGLMNNATQNKSVDNAYSLGQGNLALGNRNSDQQYSLGQASNATQNRSIDNAYDLGKGNLALGNRNSDQQYTLGQGNLALGNRSADNSYDLGKGQLANQAQGNQNSYNLGLANNNLGYANLDQNNQQFGANFGLNTMNANTNWAKTQADIANMMYQQPINNFNNFNSNTNQIAGQGGTSSQNNPGNPLVGAVGGYQLASKFF